MGLELVDSRGAPVLPRMVTHWGDGATALTNRDISTDLAKLDIALSTLRAALQQKVVKVQFYKTASLPAGTVESDIYTVPTGKNWELKWAAARVAAPPGAGSGTHEMYCTIVGANPTVGETVYPAVSGSKAFGADIPAGTLAYFGSTNGGLALEPGQEIRFTYNNATDVAQTNARSGSLTYIERSEA